MTRAAGGPNGGLPILLRLASPSPPSPVFGGGCDGSRRRGSGGRGVRAARVHDLGLCRFAERWLCVRLI